jgi:hypothetical protein
MFIAASKYSTPVLVTCILTCTLLPTEIYRRTRGMTAILRLGRCLLETWFKVNLSLPENGTFKKHGEGVALTNEHAVTNLQTASYRDFE